MQVLPANNFEFEGELQRYKVLLEMADLLVCHDDIRELLCDLSQRLAQLTSFELLTFGLHDPAQNTMRVYVLDGCNLVLAVEGQPVEESPSGWVWLHQQPLVIGDLDGQRRFTRVLPMVLEKGILSSCLLPLTRGQRRLGALGLSSTRSHAYGECDVQFLWRVSELVSLAAENALNRTAVEKEKQRLQTLLEVNAALVSNLELQELLPSISEFMSEVIKHEYASISLHDEAGQVLRQYASHQRSTNGFERFAPVLGLKDSAPGQAFVARQIKVFRREELDALHPALIAGKGGLGGLCCIPLITPKGPVGTLNLASREEDAFGQQDFGLLNQIAAQIAVALDNARAYREIEKLKDNLAEERLYLQGEIRTELNFEEIVGESAVLKRVLDQAKTVASSDATVLILGETGTGKELAARAIHRMSSRKDASFIKLNCAAIPTGLLESELFGHEKGAFTGAISQKIGRLELADKGTLFLDEVGDIPLELQPKLLRVLQDQEFERLGSIRTQRVNVRLIAATNCDLAKSVSDKEFRSDLYYRLNVFPISMPALRARQDDIPILVRYFVQKFARRMNKQIESIPAEAMNALVMWEWPGNVRELENFIERSVILSQGPTLDVPLAELKLQTSSTNSSDTLDSLQREHIMRVLRETRGVIAGTRGAAARLGLKRTTLQSRLQRLGISREDYEA